MICAKNFNYSSMIKKLESILKKEPNHDDVLEKLGVSYMINNNFRKAIEYFEKAYEINPQKMIILDHLAGLYQQVQDQEKFSKCIDTIRELGPKYINFIINYGENLINDGDVNSGVKLWVKALAFSPGNQAILRKFAYLAQRPSLMKKIDQNVMAVLTELLRPR